jgi:DNA-binding NarL/FixJ family response regulator
VLLADDHTLVRAGIRALLEKTGRVEVIGEAGNGRHALDLIRELGPDIVLLDITMPGLSGFEVLKNAREDFPDVHVIILTMHDTEEYAFQSLRSGAAGYVPKNAAITELELAIEQVMAGEKYLSPSIAQRAVLGFLESGHVGPALSELTLRQREVLILISEGCSTKAIAQALGISIKTVETHRSHLMERLDIHDVAGLVRYAIRKGMVSLDE